MGLCCPVLTFSMFVSCFRTLAVSCVSDFDFDFKTAKARKFFDSWTMCITSCADSWTMWGTCCADSLTMCSTCFADSWTMYSPKRNWSKATETWENACSVVRPSTRCVVVKASVAATNRHREAQEHTLTWAVLSVRMIYQPHEYTTVRSKTHLNDKYANFAKQQQNKQTKTQAETVAKKKDEEKKSKSFIQ